MEKLLELHKEGVNAHQNHISYYGRDYNSGEVLFRCMTLDEAFQLALEFGYGQFEVQLNF